ncbi:ABC transporter substrate-binding protein [Agrococcus carbonis]|uniref:NitT/TauT family transport system substrate-binding protein n=1 Tax=Agrococcus carbonis TaxID=684552 RepID=A0A1H1NG63_9MICO|nr:ABC transporter substrate-binding protein [Agrococcus carbonis]SDR97810.1 NitT/TauT family transport system substrate-binding protein [Agrococcus carbonis]
MHTTTTRRRAAGAVALLAAAALGLAGCSTSTATQTPAPAPDASESGALETTELLVGIVPVIDHASVFQAIEAGYFEEEGLDVTAQPAQGGAAAVPAMIAGEMQAAFATYPSFLLAQASGVEMSIVAMGIEGTEETAGVYVAEGSDIASIEDLEGATIAVNTLNNTGDLTIKAQLAEAGVDASSVQFIELPFPDMGPTLASGGVDAVWVVEPFLTGLEANGAQKVFSTYAGPTAEIPVSGIGMTREFVDANPNTVAAFQRAIERANADLAADPDIARELVTGYSQTTAEVAQQLNAPTWVEGGPSADDLQVWNDLMVELGALQEPVDLDAMAVTQG